jgi:hypothetical protein
LRAINSVRVAFAHSKKLTSFSDPEISSRLSNLKLDGNEPGIKFRFLAKLGEVEEQLRAVTDPEHQISEAFAISSRLPKWRLLEFWQERAFPNTTRRLRNRRFADSLLEDAVQCELVSEKGLRS